MPPKETQMALSSSSFSPPLLHLLTITLLQLLIMHAHSLTHPQDVQSLKHLKSTITPSTILPGSCIDTWDFTLDPCDSLFTSKFTCGLRCDAVSSNSFARVTELALDSAGYSGSITAVHFDLPYLQNLDLSNNAFTGLVPDSFKYLTRIQRIALSHNSISGKIPNSIGLLSTLQELYFDNNLLTDEIPSNLNGLTNLKRLEVQNNKIGGKFVDLGQLKNLNYLDVSDNQISGELPASFPAELIELAVRNNRLEGNIPASLVGIFSLQVVDLSNNRLTGSVPAGLFTHPNLQQLTLSNNKFDSVQVPGDSGLGSQLISVDLSGNEFRGFLPGFMGLMPRLSALSLENNKFSGWIPAQLVMRVFVPGSGMVARFERLLLGGNYLFGPIPGPFMDLKPGSVTVRLGDNCLYRCPMRLFFCEGGVQKSLMECRGFGPIAP